MNFSLEIVYQNLWKNKNNYVFEYFVIYGWRKKVGRN